MKSVWLFRIAAIVFVLFATGHTFGFLTFQAPTPEGRAVWDAMNRVSFDFNGKSFTYAGFYISFGLDISFYLCFQDFLAWYLSVMASRAPQAMKPLGWAFTVLQTAGLVLAGVYYGPIQVVIGALVAPCVAWGTITLPEAAQL
jgi:hypothetical protein